MVKILMNILMVAAGGGLGSVMRYLLAGWCQAWLRTTFPVGTLIVNVLGCLAIGVLNTAFAHFVPIREEYRVGLTVGVLGGFTTFSTFANENLALLRDGNFLLFALYTTLSVLLGLTATFLGNLMVKSL